MQTLTLRPWTTGVLRTHRARQAAPRSQPAQTMRRHGTIGMTGAVLGLLVWLGMTSWAIALPEGIPARCTTASVGVQPGQIRTMSCFLSSRTATQGGRFTTVPRGYYFLVTDIIVTPNGGSGTTEVWVQDLTNTSLEELLRLRGSSTTSFGRTFTTPYLVVQEDHRVRAQNLLSSGAAVLVDLTGLLVAIEDFPDDSSIP